MYAADILIHIKYVIYALRTYSKQIVWLCLPKHNYLTQVRADEKHFTVPWKNGVNV